MAKKKIKDERPDITVSIDGTAQWMLNSNAPIRGLYTGLFKFRCYLTPMQKIAADREYRELLGDNPAFAHENVSFMTFALTQLKQRILDAPPFWNATKSGFPGDIEDDMVIAEILDAATEAESKYRRVLEERKLAAVAQAKAAAEAILKKQKEKAEEKNEEKKTEGN